MRALTRAISCRRIGIGRDLTASPLPHHRTDGSRLRRCGGCSQGETSPQPEPRFPACQRGVHPRCQFCWPLAGGHRTAPRQATTPLDRSGLPCRGTGTMPSADFCRALREACSARSPTPGHPAALPWQAGLPSVPRRPIEPAPPLVEGGLHGRVPARPDCTTPRLGFVSLAPHVRSTRPSDPTAR
jgi:hypothetical protein